MSDTPEAADPPALPWWDGAGTAAEPGTLYVVATPIGNLGDLSRRAAAILATVDLIAAEDTRVSRKLTSHLQVPGASRLVSLHEHNEQDRAPELVERLRQGASIALVSDAGTPLLSDPGAPLVRLAAEAGLPVTAVPGPSALLAALAAAALPSPAATAAFTFRGFLPPKQRARSALLSSLAPLPEAQVFYATARRLGAVLRALEAAFGPERPAAALRDLTKRGEAAFRGSLQELCARLALPEGQDPEDLVWGEWVVVVQGAPTPGDTCTSGAGDTSASPTDADPWVEAERLIRILLAPPDPLPTKRIRDIVSQMCHLPKRDVYQRVLTIARD